MLAAFARVLDDHGFAGEVWDAGWRLAYLSNEYRTLVNAGRPLAEITGVGEHFVSREMSAVREAWPAGPTFESVRAALRGFGAFILDGTPGGLAALRETGDPRLLTVLETLTPEPPPPPLVYTLGLPCPPTTTCSTDAAANSSGSQRNTQRSQRRLRRGFGTAEATTAARGSSRFESAPLCPISAVSPLS